MAADRTPKLKLIPFLQEHDGRSQSSNALPDECSYPHLDLPEWQHNNLRWSKSFLASYQRNQATYTAYRRELERLLQWIFHIRQASLADLKRPDIEAFITFCLKPPLPWIAKRQQRRWLLDDKGEYQPNPAWRPFVAHTTKKAHREGLSAQAQQYQLSPQAIKAIFAVLSTFYQYLLQVGVAQANPVMQIRQKQHFMPSMQNQEPVRRLSSKQWQTILTVVTHMADTEPSTHERTLWIMSLLYGMYLRISELTASPRWCPSMCHFYRDNQGQWWFQTLGKGNKLRDVSVSDEMLSALARYRLFLGLSRLPSPDDHSPLVPKIRGHGPVTSTRQVRHVVQDCFDRAIAQLQAQGEEDEADQMLSATAHWLRHTGISDDVKHRPREHVRDDAGHSSGHITDRYIDITRQERHRSAKDKRLLPEEE